MLACHTSILSLEMTRDCADDAGENNFGSCSVLGRSVSLVSEECFFLLLELPMKFFVARCVLLFLFNCQHGYIEVLFLCIPMCGIKYDSGVHVCNVREIRNCRAGAQDNLFLIVRDRHRDVPCMWLLLVAHSQNFFINGSYHWYIPNSA